MHGRLAVELCTEHLSIINPSIPSFFNLKCLIKMITNQNILHLINGGTCFVHLSFIKKKKKKRREKKRGKKVQMKCELTRFQCIGKKRGEFRSCTLGRLSHTPISLSQCQHPGRLCCVLHGGSLRPLTLSPT